MSITCVISWPLLAVLLPDHLPSSFPSPESALSAESTTARQPIATNIGLHKDMGFLCLEQTIHRNAKHAQRSLIFKAFSGFLQFLQAEFRILEKRIVIDEFADAAFAAVHLL